MYRYCQRLIPVSTICHATPEDIQKNVSGVLAPHFYQNDVIKKVLLFQMTFHVYNISGSFDILIALEHCQQYEVFTTAHISDT